MIFIYIYMQIRVHNKPNRSWCEIVSIDLESKRQVKLFHLRFGTETCRNCNNVPEKSISSRNGRPNYFTCREAPNLAETARLFMHNRFGGETVGQIISPTDWYLNMQKMQQCTQLVALHSKWQVEFPHLPLGTEIGKNI